MAKQPAYSGVLHYIVPRKKLVDSIQFSLPHPNFILAYAQDEWCVLTKHHKKDKVMFDGLELVESSGRISEIDWIP